MSHARLRVRRKLGAAIVDMHGSEGFGTSNKPSGN
jgi:hypothetical protein